MKPFRIFLILCCLFLLNGCQNQQQPQQQQTKPVDLSMTIRQAALTQEERRLLALTGSSDLIFSYCADGDLQSAAVTLYQLDENNQWQQLSGGGKYNVSSADGRLALNFPHLANGGRVCFQSADDAVSSASRFPQQTAVPEDMTLQTFTAAPQPITYEQEIPLVLQCVMPKNEYTAFNTTDFEHSELFTQQGIQQVYALTVRFSRNQLGNNPLPEDDNTASVPSDETTQETDSETNAA